MTSGCHTHRDNWTLRTTLAAMSSGAFKSPQLPVHTAHCLTRPNQGFLGELSAYNSHTGQHMAHLFWCSGQSAGNYIRCNRNMC